MDLFDEIQNRRKLTFLNAYFDESKRPVETEVLEHEPMIGIHREPVAGAMHRPGNRFQPPKYKFVGKRTVRTK